MSKETIAYSVIRSLRDIGVKYVFGVPSGGWVDYMEAIRNTDGIEFVLTTHEGGASFMADVCGRLTGIPGVCFGTFGPGATNLSTGVGGAYLDRSPMIALTDEMPEPMRGRVTQMGVDHQAIFEPISKMTTRLEEGKVREQILEAARVAISERPGPVHIGMPVNLSAIEVEISEVDINLEVKQSTVDGELKQKMVELFEQAERPVLALGLGAARAGVGEQVGDFALKHNIPVVLTPMAKGMIPESHPCYAGVLFHALSDVVGETHSQSDLVIGVGYDPVEFNYEAWAPEGPVINIDSMPIDIDTAKYTVAVDLVGDIKDTFGYLSAHASSIKGWDMDAVAARKAEIFERMKPGKNLFGPCAALDVLRSHLPEDGIMTCDVGAHTHLIGQKWQTPATGLQIMTNGWSTMGFGLPAAIAAKLCRPEVSVCAVLGDGGFLMTVGELATAVRLRLKIIFVVLTDNDLALIRIKQQRKDNPIFGTVVRSRGTIGGDNLFGVPVFTASDAESFKKALEKAEAVDGPVVVEALVNSREYDELVLKKDKS